MGSSTSPLALCRAREGEPLKSSTRVVIGVGVILLVVATITYLNRHQDGGADPVSVVTAAQRPVTVIRVEAKPLVESITHSGELRAQEDVVLTAEVPARVSATPKGFGDACKKGEVAMRLDASSYQIAGQQANAALEHARAELERAEREQGRAEQLRDVAPAQELDNARSSVRAAKAQVDAAEAALRLAHRNLRETILRCPFDGEIAERFVDVGRLVAGDSPLLRVVSTGDLELTLRLSSAELSRIEPGQEADVWDPALPDQHYPGVVLRIGVAADQATRTFPVRVRVPRGQTGPRPGQLVQALIAVAKHPRALAVPEGAVAGGNGKPSLFVVRSGRAHRQTVELGPRIGVQRLVQSGLEAGDHVIVVGHVGLNDGDAVAVVDGSPASSGAP